ncbi:MAG: hypothetical protein GWP19_01470 [Planctomycetia bacterium]|nr:hypothetical protein [Planctomycetia bacterium]
MIEKAQEIVNALTEKTTIQVSKDFGLDKNYKNERTAAQMVYNLFLKVRNNPEKYNVSQESVDLAMKKLGERRIISSENRNINQSIAGFNKTKESGVEINATMMRIRDKSFKLIDQKLNTIGKNKQKLDKISFKELGTIGGIAFDKSRILQGEATEHIAVHSKIDKDISPQDAMDLVLKMREVTLAEKEKRSKISG